MPDFPWNTCVNVALHVVGVAFFHDGRMKLPQCGSEAENAKQRTSRYGFHDFYTATVSVLSAGAR